MKKYLILLLLFLSCSNNDPVSPSESSGIAIYFLEDSSIDIEQALNSDIHSLNLQSEPWLSSQDISIYDFSTHIIYLKSDRNDYMKKIEDNYNLGLLPFVFVANNQRIFIGAVYTVIMAYVPPCPVINTIFDYIIESYPNDVLYLINPTEKNNILNDLRIKNALIGSSIYHAGLSVLLNSVIIVENDDTATVKYTYKIKNNDKDNLYVPDSDLMGSVLFHCYSSGVVFWNEIGQSAWASYRKLSPDTLGAWNASWFTKILSDQEFTRTVVLKGYPKIQEGIYSCNYQYGGAFKIEPDDRYLPDGRYWLGHIPSNTITVEVKD